MAAPVVTSVVLEDLFGVTATFTGTFTDTQETGVKKVDASTLTTLLPGVTAPDLSIESIDWTCSGVGVVNLLWDAAAPVLGLAMSGQSFRHVNDDPLKNLARGAAGFTGDIKFTTTAFASGGTYSVTMRLRKDYGFTWTPIVVSNLVTDDKAGAYVTGDTMQITVVTDQIVYPDNANSGVVVFDATNDFVAEYVSGYGTKTLLLEHQITEDNHGEAGDITFEHILGIRGSSIGARQIFDTLVAVDTSGFTVNPAATISSVAVIDALSGVYVTDDVVLLEVTLSQAVKVSGIPTVPLTITSGNKEALFTGYGADHTKLQFAYTVVNEDVAEATGFDIAGDLALVDASVQNENANVDVIPTLAASDTAAFTVNAAV